MNEHMKHDTSLPKEDLHGYQKNYRDRVTQY